MSFRAVPALAFCALAILTGCASEFDVQMSSREIAADADTVFAAAQSTLRRDFDRLVIDRAARRIDSNPQEYTTQTESGTSRDWVKGGTNMRRTARLVVAPKGDASIVRLRIDREREDVSVRQAYVGETGRLSDSPSQTPIERDAATTTRQNATWVAAGRDGRLEREILEQLQRSFGRSAAADASSSTPPTASQAAASESPASAASPSAATPAPQPAAGPATTETKQESPR